VNNERLVRSIIVKQRRQPFVEYATVIILLPLLVDLALGFVVRLKTRRAFWSILACLLIPPAVAVVSAGPLLGERTEAEALMLCIFFWTPFGFAGCATGVIFGYLLRQRRQNDSST
jgi:hypothetical protein